MAHVKRKTGDTRPLEAVLRDKSGPVDLTATTVRFLMKPHIAGVGQTVNAECDIVQSSPSTNKGLVSYAFETADVEEPGMHRAEFEVTWQDGTTETFPDGSAGDDYLTIELLQDLS